MYEIKTEDVYEDFSSDKEMFDFSDYSTKSKYCEDSKKLVIGNMKDETGGVAIEDFFALKAKMYSFLVDDNSEHKINKRYEQKDFPLQIPTNLQNNCVYFSGSKNDINLNRFFQRSNKFSKKVMEKSVVSWNGVSKPFFVGGSNLKSNSRSYLEHLRNDLILAMKELCPSNNLIFIQDSAPSHRAKIVQNLLRKELKSRFVANTEWPSSSPSSLYSPFSSDCNPVDYYLWNEVKEKVYSGHLSKFFELLR